MQRTDCDIYALDYLSKPTWEDFAFHTLQALLLWGLLICGCWCCGRGWAQSRGVDKISLFCRLLRNMRRFTSWIVQDFDCSTLCRRILRLERSFCCWSFLCAVWISNFSFFLSLFFSLCDQLFVRRKQLWDWRVWLCVFHSVVYTCWNRDNFLNDHVSVSAEAVEGFWWRVMFFFSPLSVFCDSFSAGKSST